VKPVIDWVQDGKTGAVAELEGAVSLRHAWRVQLMLGGRLWARAYRAPTARASSLRSGKTF
jgi:hypothetical protein